jgi:hypothetical protein
VLVTGSRTWTDEHAIHDRLLRCPAGTVIVHGQAKRGADAIADRQAKLLGLEVDPHPADWERHGRKAGPIRNREMLDSGIDLVLAFWDGMSRGTKDCIEEAQRRGIPVEVLR